MNPVIAFRLLGSKDVASVTSLSVGIFVFLSVCLRVASSEPQNVLSWASNCKPQKKTYHNEKRIWPGGSSETSIHFNQTLYTLSYKKSYLKLQMIIIKRNIYGGTAFCLNKTAGDPSNIKVALVYFHINRGALYHWDNLLGFTYIRTYKSVIFLEIPFSACSRGLSREHPTILDTLCSATAYIYGSEDF
jgi:hypothetical protein